MKQKYLRDSGEVLESNGRRYPKEEFAQRGDELYYKKIRPRLGPKDRGKFLAIDIETGDYELARDEMKAGNKLRARIPDAQLWMVRVGYPSRSSIWGPGRPGRQAMIKGV